MGRVFLVELDGKSFRCRFCNTHLALEDDILSRVDLRMLTYYLGFSRGHLLQETRTSAILPSAAFTCRKGKAFLFSNVVNVTVGVEEERMMRSGMHTVEDIFCCCCGQLLGWKYVIAHEKHQKDKEGKFVLERWRIVDNNVAEECSTVDVRLGSSDAENSY